MCKESSLILQRKNTQEKGDTHKSFCDGQCESSIGENMNRQLHVQQNMIWLISLSPSYSQTPDKCLFSFYFDEGYIVLELLSNTPNTVKRKKSIVCKIITW